jgi:GSH-dependent disulfide-bond oxidoreductase
MMQLYHWEPNGACGRVMIVLREKGLDFHSHYLDVLAFEQHAPAFLELSESGEVPVLVDHGAAMNESSYICEYLEETYPEIALMPRDPRERWEARVWQKYVDDYVAASTCELAWQALEAHRFRNRDRAALDSSIARIPMKERRDAWTAAINGYGEEQLRRARERLNETIIRMEADLDRSGWLVGSAYSLADVALFAYISYLPRVAPDLVNDKTVPGVMAWLRRVKERPGVKAALAMSRRAEPFATAAPGPEQVRWG